MCNRFRADKHNEGLYAGLDPFDERGRNMPTPFEMFPNTPGRYVHLNPEGRLTLTEGLWGMPSPAMARRAKLMPRAFHFVLRTRSGGR